MESGLRDDWYTSDLITFLKRCEKASISTAAMVRMAILKEWYRLPDTRIVIVATPRRAQTTKMDRPAGDLGEISPVSPVSNSIEIIKDGATITNGCEADEA